MRRLNIRSPRFDYEADDPAGFRSGMMRLGPLLSASQLGLSVYELPPGQAICPYHYEYAEEEWLRRAGGAPDTAPRRGQRRARAWDVVCFPRGPEGAHGVRTETDETVRVVMFSTVLQPAATVYPDSDKIAIWTGNSADDVIVPRASGVDYWDGETPAP